jgi:hypothetical protein
MKSPKFDEHDRRKVISEVEDHFSVHLSPVGTRRKFLEDGNGKTFWVLGGYEDWHGIPPEMLEEEERRSTNGVLVVAKRYKSRIDVYSGPLEPLIKNKELLSHAKKGDYQFNINIRGNHLFIKEIPDLSLAVLGESQYSVEEKDSDKKLQALKGMFSKLSSEEQQELLQKLRNEQET